ncbi:MAG: glycosyltransferase [Timaviella obliquedivisa GSE-PSE-MK23-08B]|nr:glycosyltransferase [Timaviella obliquedivisa GSE-PSE-MK23-08B]
MAERLPCLLSDRSVQPLVKVRPLSQCNICVIIPVRDEAETIESTLLALVHQVNFQGCPLDPDSYEVIVLANNCRDNSAAIARRFAEQYPTFVLHVVEIELPHAQAYIGRVRQLLMDEAYYRLVQLGHNRGLIASTDGDTRVAPNWIAATLEEIHRGADAVSGRLLTDRNDRALLDTHTRACYLRAVGYGYLSVELEAYIDPDPFDCLPRHHQHGGASLAVTAEMYAIAGGMPSVRTPEDVAFYQALVRVGARFCHSSQVRVFTSMRRQGRTDNGMANQLSQWTDLGQQHQPYLVESAAALETRWWGRKNLRSLWRCTLDGFPPKAQEIRAIANLLQVNALWLNQAMVKAGSFAELFMLVEQQQMQEGNWQKTWKPVEIKRAIADLRLRINRLRQEQQLRLAMTSYPTKFCVSNLAPYSSKDNLANSFKQI